MWVAWRARSVDEVPRRDPRHARGARHTFASRFLKNGESPAYVKEQMAHHSIEVTADIYWAVGTRFESSGGWTA